jgi:hypothetical protein
MVQLRNLFSASDFPPVFRGVRSFWGENVWLFCGFYAQIRGHNAVLMRRFSGAEKYANFLNLFLVRPVGYMHSELYRQLTRTSSGSLGALSTGANMRNRLPSFETTNGRPAKNCGPLVVNDWGGLEGESCSELAGEGSWDYCAAGVDEAERREEAAAGV